MRHIWLLVGLVACVNSPSRTELIPLHDPPRATSDVGLGLDVLVDHLVASLKTPAPRDRAYAIGVRSVRFLRNAEVRSEPRLDATKLGQVRSGTRSAIVRAQPGDGDCARWIAIAPRGWVCEDVLEPSEQPPSVTETVALDSVPADDRALVPGVYGVVRGADVQAYSTKDDVAEGNGRVLDGPHSVRLVGGATVDGVRYYRTSQGDLIEATSIAHFSPSKFKGVVITDPDAMPAWVRRHDKPRDPILVRDAAGKITGKVAARAVVTIAELSPDGKRARITDADGDDGWVERRDLRATALTAPPAGTAADEKWFDVDVEQQVLVAYEGDKPVYATMISSGKYQHDTPAIIARIASKHLTAHMVNPKGNERYSVADVPWTMYYDGNYALHTSYWHDGFGSVRSHGCINLSPRDARVLYHWSSPDVPPGWTAVYGDAAHPGSLVRVRSRRVPDPAFRGYAKTLVAATD